MLSIYETTKHCSCYLGKVWWWPDHSVLGDTNLMENTALHSSQSGCARLCVARDRLARDRHAAFLLRPRLPGQDASGRDFRQMNSEKPSGIHDAISPSSFSFYPRTLPISVTTTINKRICTLLLSCLVSALPFLLLLVFSLDSFFLFISSLLLSFGGSGS